MFLHFFTTFFKFLGAQSCREKRNENKKELPKSDIQYNSHRILSTYRPKCRLYTEFPFDDLTTVTKDITCTTQMTLSPATINDTGVYICKSKIAFKSIGANQQNATKDSGTNNTIVNIGKNHFRKLYPVITDK